MADDLDLLRNYAACMEELKLRCSLILSITSGEITVAGREDFSGELACLNLRKVLELLAFASLTANKEKYAKAHGDFARQWNARRLLANLERLHPGFYPTPIVLADQDSSGVKNFADVTEPYLTQEDFVFLYNKTSQVLHSPNPYRHDRGVIDFGHSIAEWVHRVQTLLSTHYMRLVNNTSLWVVVMKNPIDGKVHVMRADPRPPDGDQRRR